MKTKKMDIKKLSVASFVTSIASPLANTVKGKGPESDIIELCPDYPGNGDIAFK